MLKNSVRKHNESNREFAYRTIRDSIIELFLKPGEQLSEISIAEKLSLSRTPIREALILLDNEDLVTVQPKYGTFVTKIDMSDIEELIFMRNTLEKEVIKLAMDQGLQPEINQQLIKLIDAQKTFLALNDGQESLYLLDNEFHRTIYQAVNKESLWSTIDKLSGSFNRLRKLDILGNISTKIRIDEHQQLLTLINEKRYEQINGFVEEHIAFNELLLPSLRHQFIDYFEV